MIDFGVVKDFDRLCAAACDMLPELTPYKDQLVEFAKDHPNRSILLNNLCQQIQGAELNLKFKGPELARKRRNQIIAYVAQLYMTTIKAKRDNDLLTESAQILIQKKRSVKEEVAQLIKEVPSVIK